MKTHLPASDRSGVGVPPSPSQPEDLGLGTSISDVWNSPCGFQRHLSSLPVGCAGHTDPTLPFVIQGAPRPREPVSPACWSSRVALWPQVGSLKRSLVQTKDQATLTPATYRVNSPSPSPSFLGHPPNCHAPPGSWVLRPPLS